MIKIFLAEQHPTFCWHFDWRQYVVVGEPDGITDDFVYEFKSTTDRRHMKLVAERQGAIAR